MKPSSRKQKGRRFQQQIARDIADAFELSYGEDADVESRGMGQSGTDVRLSPFARQFFPYSVECKAQENLSWWDAIAQAKANVIEGTTWLLVVKRNRMAPVVILDWEEFLELSKMRGRVRS